MSVGKTPPAAAVTPPTLTSEQTKYDAEENRLLRRISESLDYYRTEISATQKWHRRLTISTMVLSILTPLFVAGSATVNSNALPEVFHFPSGILATTGILLSIAVAIIEGFKQIYKFGDRVTSCYTAKLAIRRALDTYKLKKIGLVPGSADWLENYFALRTAYENASDADTQGLFKSMQTPNK